MSPKTLFRYFTPLPLGNRTDPRPITYRHCALALCALAPNTIRRPQQKHACPSTYRTHLIVRDVSLTRRELLGDSSLETYPARKNPTRTWPCPGTLAPPRTF